jgi:hypothetical protein
VELLLIVIVVGIAVLITAGITVGIMESRQRAVWRQVAHERRRRWERERDVEDDE